MANNVVVTQPAGFDTRSYSRQWSTGICQCLEDLPSCCFSFWCFWCFTCKTSQDFGEGLCLPLVDICLGGLVKPVTLSMRAVMRKRYGIEDTICNDCIYACCCGPCSWCQIRREMKARLHPVTLINNRAQ
ncbi:hypothetical protein ACEWY4_024798 [Coilia grayii]|uniref:Plac8 onzin related protein 3 n=1 Tax=Coilia grayii TaxID=363190 RepID=A0ABD1IVZ7_9TELE